MLNWTKRVALGVVALTGVVIVSGIAFEQWSRWNVSRDFEPVGQLIVVDGGKMHLNCSGNGAPTVILESGMGDDSSSWSEIHPEIAKTNRVCSYDRVGRLWSDASDGAITAAGTAARLHNLLGLALEVPPYVMVGHSLGGALVMVFADKYPEQVVGVVLVDSAHPDQDNRYPLWTAAADSIGGWNRILLKIKAETGFMRLFESGVYDGMPYEDLASVNFQPQSMSAVFVEMDLHGKMIAEASDLSTLGDLPLIVLTSRKYPKGGFPEITPEQWSQFDKAKAEMQIELAALSTRSEQRIFDDVGHYIHWGDPDAAIQAIRDVVADVQDLDAQN